MRTYTRKSTRGYVSYELMQKAVDVVFKDCRNKIKTVTKELHIHIEREKNENELITIASSDMIKANFSNINETLNNNTMANITIIRVKRQASGASKFTQASKMPQVKQLRVFLQLFKNFWDDAYIGGAHPLHHHVPKTVIALYKQRIMQFFFPSVGEDKV